MTKFALIGDIHSQATNCYDAVNYCVANGYTPVFLGDLFDSRTWDSDSVGVYKIAREAEKELGAVIIASNHQDKLRGYLWGNPVDLSSAPELIRTLEDFEASGINNQELNFWLSNLPYGVCFKEGGREYRCSHAYFSALVPIPEYTSSHCVYFKDITKKTRSWMLYGKRAFDGSRVYWWEKPNLNPWIRVAGHYHIIHIDLPNGNLVLDGDCGGGGQLPLYLVDKGELLLF